MEMSEGKVHRKLRKEGPWCALKELSSIKKAFFFFFWKEQFCRPLDHELKTPFFNPRDGIKSTIMLEMAWALVHSLLGT